MLDVVDMLACEEDCAGRSRVASVSVVAEDLAREWFELTDLSAPAGPPEVLGRGATAAEDGVGRRSPAPVPVTPDPAASLAGATFSFCCAGRRVLEPSLLNSPPVRVLGTARGAVVDADEVVVLVDTDADLAIPDSDGFTGRRLGEAVEVRDSPTEGSLEISESLGSALAGRFVDLVLERGG